MARPWPGRCWHTPWPSYMHWFTMMSLLPDSWESVASSTRVQSATSRRIWTRRSSTNNSIYCWLLRHGIKILSLSRWNVWCQWDWDVWKLPGHCRREMCIHWSCVTMVALRWADRQCRTHPRCRHLACQHQRSPAGWLLLWCLVTDADCTWDWQVRDRTRSCRQVANVGVSTWGDNVEGVFCAVGWLTDVLDVANY